MGLGCGGGEGGGGILVGKGGINFDGAFAGGTVVLVGVGGDVDESIRLYRSVVGTIAASTL